jgi:hypothetical protein
VSLFGIVVFELCEKGMIVFARETRFGETIKNPTVSNLAMDSNHTIEIENCVVFPVLSLTLRSTGHNS